MLEGLISSRIRRTLIEHLLSFPENRFYLRGLAKELGLSISPLRRELKKLNEAGLLKAYQEGNILFYVVDRTHPLFIQLAQALNKPQTGSETKTYPEASEVTLQPALTVEKSFDITKTPQPEIVSKPQKRISWPFLVGSLAVVSVVALTVGISIYLVSANKRLLDLTKDSISKKGKQVTVVQPSSSGQMRSSHWRVLPGVAGGFGPGTGARQESY